MCNAIVVGGLILFSLIASAQTSPTKQSNIELRLRTGQLINGVPETISFVFVNIGDQEVRIPPVSPCIGGQYSGTLKSRLELSPVVPQGTGKGGGCGVGASHVLGILEQAKSWRRLQPRQWLIVSYKRNELFVFEQTPGAYDFWGEYEPPHLRAETSWLSNMRESTSPASP